MRHLWAIIFALVASIAAAQDLDIKSVIRDQIAAFQADDFSAAFDQASPKIQRHFGTSERFGQMVQQGYPMVWRPKALRFLEQRTEDGLTWQRVLVRDSQGRGHVLDYQMIRTETGWKINEVRRVPLTGPTA